MEEKRKKFEVEILRIMLERLERGDMSADRARRIAQLVLKLLPEGITLGEFYRVVPKLDDEFSELSKVVLPVLQEYEQKVEMKVKEKVEEMVKRGDFSAAVVASKGGL